MRVTTQLARMHGLSKFSINELSAQLGISKSMVYDRFQSRADLISEVLVEYYSALLRDANDVTRNTPKGIQRLVRIIDMWLGEYVLKDGGCLLLRAASEYCASTDELTGETMRFVVNGWRNCLDVQLRDAVVCGEIPSDVDTRLLGFEIYGFVLGIHHDCIFLGKPVSFRAEAFSKIFSRHGINLPINAALRKFQ